MTATFMQLAEDRKRNAIQECAVRKQIAPVIIEKDFWVCWMLSVLFRSSFADDLVFKGGTSLSKVLFDYYRLKIESRRCVVTIKRWAKCTYLSHLHLTMC